MEKFKHSVLPKAFDLGSTELARWLASQSVNTFIEPKKEYFSPEEIAEYEHESSANGREFNRLAAIKQYVSDLVRKGTGDATSPITITIPVTVGQKSLETFRRQNDDLIEMGFISEDVEVYAIPDVDFGKMEFFDSEGHHYADRTRELSISEKHKFGGIFNIESTFASKVEGSTGEIIDESPNAKAS